MKSFRWRGLRSSSARSFEFVIPRMITDRIGLLLLQMKEKIHNALCQLNFVSTTKTIIRQARSYRTTKDVLCDKWVVLFIAGVVSRLRSTTVYRARSTSFTTLGRPWHTSVSEQVPLQFSHWSSVGIFFIIIYHCKIEIIFTTLARETGSNR